jgi:hypothetical protein
MVKNWNEIHRKEIIEGMQVEEKEHKDTIRSTLNEALVRSQSGYACTRISNENDITRVARQIAIDHLKEDPKYYQKLKKLGL